ncbi:MAG: ankyrin repeat domain-containing protein [Fibromonadaceae bacterium]|jgi:hypothetical protein|nr:ankyrin repeat domain-containing protein [Fibromonadaceae bacterium]
MSRFEDIFVAAHKGTAEDVKYFVEKKGININAKDENGFAPLHMAIVYGNLETVKALAELGANLSIKSQSLTPLHMAAVSKNTAGSKNLDIAKFLVYKGADVNAKTDVNDKGESYTPIFFAQRVSNDTAMVKYLEIAEEEREEQKRKEIEAEKAVEMQELRLKNEQERKEQELREKERLMEEERLERERTKKFKESSDMEFTVDFLREFLKQLEKFNNACEKIEPEAEKELRDIISKQKEDETQMLIRQKNVHSFVIVNSKESALRQYESKLQELNKKEENRQNSLYDKITKCKAQNIKNKSANNEEIEHIRADIFANKENIKQERDKLWSEYQSQCAKILQDKNTQQEKNNEERNREYKKRRESLEKSETEFKEKIFNRIKQEMDNFINIKAFDPDKINEMYAKAYATDPLVGDYKCVKPENHPNSVRMATLSRDLSTLNLGKHAKELLETYYPMLYREKKLIIPNCINVSETNGICFLQTNDNRSAVYKTVQSFILKLLLQIQPGLLKLTLYDGEGSGKNLIGLSHIDKRIKGENILTDTSELKRALEAAVSDMNTTIQKVLGSKYADKTLIDYNEDAGKQAKPYHIICITDFPNGIGKEHFELITKIVRSGKQAGVFVIMGSDTEFAPKNSYDRIDTSSLLSEMSVVKVGSLDNNIRLCLNNDFPDTDLLEQIQEHISAEIKKVSKVEVNLDNKVGEDKLWQSDSRNGIETPIGQLNVTELQNFTLSVEDGSANIPHHCLIGGATGSGKTVLLHNIICYTAWNYSPDEVQFILLDYKEGTEFKVYENLPHAKVLSIHSEREYGISVLEYISTEIERRGKEFKKVNAQNIAKYRENKPEEKMPRLMIIIDEFQVLLNGDMKTSTFVSKALDDIGRRGRSFGINLILSSQSLSGVDINQTLSHLGLRIALQLNTEKDCDHFLGQGNYAPFKTLQKKGEAIYNAKSGLTEGNIPFQVAYLSDKDIGNKISALQKKSIEIYGSDKPFTPRFLYDGNVNASFVEREYTPDDRKCKVYVGEPVALEAEHASYSLLRQNESNVLIVGQDILAAMSILNYSIRQIIPQSAEECQVYVCNKVNMDNDHYGELDSLPKEFSSLKLLENDQEISKTIENIFEEVEKRKAESNKSRIILVFADIYNVRLLRKSGYTDSPLVQKLITILKDGPGFGIHCIVHASSYDNLKNVLDVHSLLNEFNVRIELRGGDGYKIFQSNDVGIEKSTPDKLNTANMQTSQMNEIRKIKVYSF